MKNSSLTICLSIGYPLKNSKSPAIHNAGYRALGLQAEYAFLPAQVRPENLEKTINGLKDLGIRGVSVTMPYKEEVMKYLDEIDSVALKIGAVNTIVNRNGKLTGYNTDWKGALVALEKKTKVDGKKVAVIGAGGAARAIVYALVKNGAEVKIFNRSVDKAEELAHEFGCEFGDLDSLSEVVSSDIIINTTSVGMNEDLSLVDESFLNKRQIVFDIVYTPKETRLIKTAKEKGAQVIYGYEMLLYQGIEQFKMYTEMEAPAEEMEKALLESL